MEDLLKQELRVYVYLKDSETADKFLIDAELEEYTFGDGVKSTCRKPDHIFAINEDMTINYVGFIGHIRFESKDKRLLKMDYFNHSNGLDSYYL